MGVAASMVTVLFGAAWLIPAPSGTSVARATFPVYDIVSAAPHVGVPLQRLRYTPQTAVEADDAAYGLADMETASGHPAGGLGGLHPLLDYDLNAVLHGAAEVPRLTLVNMPVDLSAIRETDERKAVFFKSVLPLVLQVNEQIVQDRQRLWQLHAVQASGEALNALDRLWLAAMAERYGTQRGDIQALLDRHDIVPPSLALAQAASESAWGTSRFVREGNAMFGEWTFSKAHKGIVPNDRELGKQHRVRAFDNLTDSVKSYVTNLNKHRAYKEYRAKRAEMRAQGKPVNGMILAGALHRYSERGAVYVAELRAIISGNDLDLLDTAQLNAAGDVEPVI